MESQVRLDPNFVDPDAIIDLYPYLQGLEYEDLQQIFSQAIHEATLNPRQVLYDQDQPIEYVYVLVEGAVRQARTGLAADGTPQQTLVREVNTPGTLIGIYDFLFSDTYRARAKATTRGRCRLLAVDAAALSRLIYRFPDVRDALAPIDMLSRLRTIPMLGRLEEVALGFLADSIDQRDFAPESTIYAPGTTDPSIYLINRGQVKLEWSDGETDWLGNGAVFGLLRPSNQTGISRRLMTHSATSQTHTHVFCMDFEAFKGITGIDPDRQGFAEMAERERTLADLMIFQDFSPSERRHLVGYLSHYYFPSNHQLIQQGEEADSLWILMAGGQAAIHALDGEGNKLMSTSSPGPTYFGETALLGQVPQDSSVEAQAGGEWLRLHRSDFRAFEASEPDNIASKLVVRTKRRQVIASKEQRKKYDWLQPGELLVLFSRRHWIAYLRKGVPSFILFAILFAFTIFGAIIPGIQIWIVIPTAMLALVTLLFFVWGTIDYFNDWVVVTNRRVVHQEKVLFVNEWRKEAPLEQIQNVNFETTFLGRWLNYGTMVIETASTSGVIAFDYTTHFDQLYSAITEQRAQRRRHSAAQSKLTIHRVLEGRLGLSLTLPALVYTGGIASESEQTWRNRMTQSVNQRMRREEGDRIIWRKHWMVLIPKLWVAILVLLFWVVLTLLPNLFALMGFTNQWTAATVFLQVVGLILTLIALARVAWVVANWRNDTYEVSDDEIVHIEKLPLSITENRKAAGLGRIQNVEMVIPSPIHWLFNFGHVRCQTAAEYGDFVFQAVPEPREVAAEIQARMERYARRMEEDSARKRAQELPDWFEVYNTLGMEEVAEQIEQENHRQTNGSGNGGVSSVPPFGAATSRS